MDFIELHKILSRTKIKHWREILPKTLDELNHGDLDKWLEVFQYLPNKSSIDIDLKSNTVKIGDSIDLCNISKQQLTDQLMKLHPWRKGPYDFFGININTEWRSDFKWDRLINHISP